MTLADVFDTYCPMSGLNLALPCTRQDGATNAWELEGLPAIRDVFLHDCCVVIVAADMIVAIQLA